MANHLAVALFALAQPQPAEEPGLVIASDKDWSTSVRLVETADAVRFEFTGPTDVLPTVAIDVNRNGVIDRNTDFQVSPDDGGSSCLQYLIREGASSTCKPFGEKGTLVRSPIEQGTATTLSFPKREISGDGFGFGFAVKLWSLTGHYGTSLAGGDYQFGGKLSLVSEGPNFLGGSRPNIPPPVLAMLHRYQGCVNKALDALAPLGPSVAAKIRALPATCAGERTIALDGGINALVASGTPTDEATERIHGYLDDYDEQIGDMAERLEKGSK